MSSSSKRGRLTGKGNEVPSFAGIPRYVMHSADFRALGPNSVRVLIWLAESYKGRNNGNLSATINQAQYWGIAGKDTLHKALKELTEKRLIIRTREGRFTNPGGQCALYAMTWAAIDECLGKSLEVEPTSTPPRKDWRRT